MNGTYVFSMERKRPKQLWKNTGGMSGLTGVCQQ